MSTVTGHWKITKQAVSELQQHCAYHPRYRIESGNIPTFVVLRDVLDFVSLGHWANYAQSHHFMRSFDGKSPAQAYNANVEWIRSNAVSASEVLAQKIRA